MIFPLEHMFLSVRALRIIFILVVVVAVGIMGIGFSYFPLLSGYKSNRFSWLKKQGKSSWESIC